MKITQSNQIGKLVRRARKAKGLSQYELAEKAMVSPRWLILLETGKNVPQLDLVLRTLSVLDLNLTVEAAPSHILDDLLKS